MKFNRVGIMRAVSTTLICSASLVLSSGCMSEPVTESNLTAGMAKATIVKGETTQAEVMEVFGPPDLVTHKDDMQVWTYDKISQNVSTSSGYLTVFFAGVGGGRSTSSSRSTMLIIYFDSTDVVRDYRMSVTKF